MGLPQTGLLDLSLGKSPVWMYNARCEIVNEHLGRDNLHGDSQVHALVSLCIYLCVYMPEFVGKTVVASSYQ